MTKENKIKLGRYIGYYRRYNYKVSGLSKWTQKEFSKQHGTGDRICSERVLGYIENGKIDAKDEVYEMLLRNFDVIFSENMDIDTKLEEWSESFYEFMKRYDRQRINILISEIENYSESKSSAIYNEFLQCIKLIVNYEFDNITISNMDYYLMIAKAINYNKLSFLVAISIIDMNFETYVSNEIMLEAADLFYDNKQDDEIFQEVTACFKKSNCKYIEAYELLKDCYSIHEAKNNRSRQLKVFLDIISIEENFDPQGAITLKISLIKDILKSKDLPKKLRIDAYSIIAMVYFTIENYKESLTHFEKILEEASHLKYAISPYYFKIKEILGMKIIFDEISNDAKLASYEEHYYAFYEYYILKHKLGGGDKELLDYLLKTVKPAIMKGVYGIETVRIFRDEVAYLSNKTRTYSALYNFDLETKKLLNR